MSAHGHRIDRRASHGQHVRTPGRLLRRRITNGAALTVLGAALAVPALAITVRESGGATRAEPRALTTVPASTPRLGLVYQGLSPAVRGTACVGGYDVARDLCTNGPDAPPSGLSVQRDVAPVGPSIPTPTLPRQNIAAVPDDPTIWRDVGAVSTGATAVIGDEQGTGQSGITCDGDGESGKRVQVLYVYQTGTASRYSQYLSSFQHWAAGVDAIYDASAAETGSTRHVRYVTSPGCQVSVAEVEVPAGALDSLTATITVLRTLGYARADRKYMVFADANVYCGIGTFVNDDRPGEVNRNNSGPGYGRVDAGCWNPGVAARELAHNLGAVSDSAPHSTHNGHCTDGHDVMCVAGAAVCGDPGHDQRLDCGHDDYYSTTPEAGGYLATHWNVADSQFLIGAPPAPSAPESPVTLQIAATASTSIRLEWNPAEPGVHYGVLVNGQLAGETTATAVRLIGLRPATTYQTQVVIRDPAGITHPYTELAITQTGDSARPAGGPWFTMGNALTGEAADLYAARAAAGAPLTLQPRTGAADQGWRLDPAGDGTYLLESRATGKCVVPRGGTAVPGAPLVQQACPSIPAAGQLWQIIATEYGFTLAAVVDDRSTPAATGAAATGRLVIGVGQPRFGGHRLLVLQHPTQARHQSWTALP